MIQVPENFSANIIKTAESFIGQTEISGNKGWNDKKFQKLMERCGWETGQAWCAYAGELVYKLAANPDPEKWKDDPFVILLNKLFSAGAVKTLENFIKDQSGLFEFTKNPKQAGDLVIYKTYTNGKPSWTGHLAILKQINNLNLKTYEGNTNKSGGREGIEFAEMKRYVDYNIPNKGTKLVLQGFITLK